MRQKEKSEKNRSGKTESTYNNNQRNHPKIWTKEKQQKSNKLRMKKMELVKWKEKIK